MQYGWTEYADSPTTPAITVAEAKAHLRVDYDTDDDLISVLIDAATQQAEAYTRAAITARLFTMTLGAFPRISRGQSGPDPDYAEFPSRFGSSGRPARYPTAICLPVWPLISLSSIQYIDADTDALTTLASSSYVVVSSHRPPMIVPAAGTAWPVAGDHPEAVRITFRAGMAEADGGIPAVVKSAIKLIVGHLYEHREDVTPGVGAPEPALLPMGSRYLLNPYRMWPL